MSFYQQDVEHPHVGSVLLKNPVMTAAAHPTPVFTLMASVLQFCMQAPHSMHLSKLTLLIFLLYSCNTLRGQTKAQSPQPVHLA
jgi:hypothetical protein